MGVAWLACLLAGFSSVAAQDPPCGKPDPGPLPSGAATSRAAGAFPDHGTINALVVFVQRSDDTFDDCNDITQSEIFNGRIIARQVDREICINQPHPLTAVSTTDDPVTEWPAAGVDGQGPSLPSWGPTFLAPPGAAPSSFEVGSLSHYYHLMSGGRFTLTGVVYPEVYSPALPDSSYHYRNKGGFPTGLTKLSHEILTHVGQNPHGIVFDGRFDRYRNGTHLIVDDDPAAPDGVFDMVILVFRNLNLCPYWYASGSCGGGTRPSAVSTLGVIGGNPDGFASAPLFLGGLRVTDAFPSGSGVIVQSTDRLWAIVTSAHEIGHRQISHHTSEKWDPFSIMRTSVKNGPVSMSASDRYFLGWTPTDEVSLTDIATGFPEGAPRYLMDPVLGGSALLIPSPGDERHTLVEARTWSNPYDAPPDGTLADGDWADPYLTEEGVTATRLVRCSTTVNTGGNSQSIENTGLPDRTASYAWTLTGMPHLGIAGQRPNIVFGPDDTLTPLTAFHPSLDPVPAVDRMFGVTDIQAVGSGSVSTGFDVRLWGDLLGGHGNPDAKRVLGVNQTFTTQSLARWDDWTIGGVLRLTEDLPAEPIGTPSVTMLPGASFEVETATVAFAGTPARLFPFRFGNGARFSVTGGQLFTDYVSFNHAPDADGWDGIRFVQNHLSQLTRTKVSGVASTDPLGVDVIPGAVSVYGGFLDLGYSTVSDNATAGVYVSGSGSEVLLYGDTQTQTRIRDNTGYGVVVADEGRGRLDAHSILTLNAAGGVYASGKGAVITLDAADVSGNLGPGVTAAALGEVQTVGAPSTIGDNRGGLNAVSGGAVFVGVCPTDPCAHDPNQLPENYNPALPGTYDARSVLGSVLLAEGNTWGATQSAEDLELVRDASSYLSVEPVIPAFGLRSAPSGAAAAGVDEADGAAQRIEAAPLFALTSRHLATGDTLAAGGAVLGALAEAQTGAERRAAFEAAARLFARVRPPALLAAVEGVAAAPDTASAHPWALRALVVARAEAGRWSEAETAAATLAALYAGTEHGVAGLAARVSLAVEQDDEDGAILALAALAAAHPEAEATARVGALVAAAFPRADVGGAFRAGRSAGPATAGTGPSSEAMGGAPERVAVGAVRPNPTAGTAAVSVALPRAAHVYDALGQRVAVLTAGEQAAGVCDLAVPHLPAGVYLVRVVVREAGAAPHVEVRRLTVVR